MPSLFVFVALPCEAKPLIQRWRLKKHPHKHPFAIYTDNERTVVVTGIGKVAMAGAVGYTLSLFQGPQHLLLVNFGIAGHCQHNLGSLYLADKIVDNDTGKKFYPQLPFGTACETASVATLAKPQEGYAGDYLYDMEAAAFYEIACKFSSSELIHSLKIISDNTQSPLANISEDSVECWIAQHLDTIDNLLVKLDNCRCALPSIASEVYEQLATQFHFTASNAVRLKTLLQSWKLLNPNCELDWRNADVANGKGLIAWLEQQLEKNDFFL
jgi:nucleoside phosphorylase